MDPQFCHRTVELTSLAPARLADSDGLSAMVVAAAGAVGMPPLGPPVVRGGPGGVAVALLCRDGHIIVHTVPSDGRCFAAVVARAPAEPGRGLDVITRALAKDVPRPSP